MGKSKWSKKELGWLLGMTAFGLVVRLAVWLYFASDLHLLVTSKLPDDALYYFTAARSLAQGHGITYDGIHPTNGMHPLWLFVITPIFFLGLTKWGLIFIVLFVQSLLDVATIWLIGSTTLDLLSDRTSDNRLSAALGMQFLYAVSPIVLIQSINGLETTLTALLFVVWLRQFGKAVQQEGMISWVWLAIATGFLFLSRTDSFLVILPVVIYALVTKRGTPKQYLIAILIAIAIVSPWIVWNIAEFGSPLQTSAEAVPFFAMKKYQAIYGGSMYLHLALDAARNVLKPFIYSSFGLSLVGVLIFVRRKQLTHWQWSLMLMLAGGMLLLAVHTLFRGFIREWYVEQLIPIYLIGFGISIALLAGEVVYPWRRAVEVVVASVLLWFLITPHFASQQSVVQQGVPIVQRLTGKSRVASLNSGYYSYFASRDGSAVNMDGVVNPEAFAHIKKGDLGRYLLNDSVDYVLDFAGDLGGYTGLIDNNLLSGFVMDSTIQTSDAHNPLMLYKRRDLHEARGIARP